MKNLDNIAEDFFNKVRSRFSDIKLGDAEGVVTSDPSQARFFDINFTVGETELGRVNVKLDDKSLAVIFNNGIVEGQGPEAKEEWFAFLKDARQFARKNLLNFDTRDITKSNLEKRDYQHLANSTGEKEMSESKLFGTSKTSYQDMGEAKIIVKHSAPVNYDNPAGRTQRIESIYIESSTGERFRYPHRHLNGARALAVHVANGGTPYDAIGTHISGLSEELSKLRQFKNYTHKSGVMAEALGDITEKVADRIDTIKNEIFALQKQGYYEQFKESFAPSESQEVPEEMANAWVDALTIKTFNEELKSVFPYIYKLVAEKREGELEYEDLVKEGTCPVCNEDPCTCEKEVEENLGMFDEFVQGIEELAKPAFEAHVTGVDYILAGIAKDEDMDALYAIHSNPKTSAEKYASNMIDDMYQEAARDLGAHADDDFEEIYSRVMDQLIEKYADADLSNDGFGEPLESANQSQSGIPQEVVEFISSMYDRQTGTFPRGEEGVKIAVEKKFGEQAGRFAHYVVEKLSAKNQPAVQEAEVEAPQESAELLSIRKLAGI